MEQSQGHNLLENDITHAIEVSARSRVTEEHMTPSMSSQYLLRETQATCRRHRVYAQTSTHYYDCPMLQIETYWRRLI